MNDADVAKLWRTKLAPVLGSEDAALVGSILSGTYPATWSAPLWTHAASFDVLMEQVAGHPEVVALLEESIRLTRRSVRSAVLRSAIEGLAGLLLLDDVHLERLAARIPGASYDRMADSAARLRDALVQLDADDVPAPPKRKHPMRVVSFAEPVD